MDLACGIAHARPLAVLLLVFQNMHDSMENRYEDGLKIDTANNN